MGEIIDLDSYRKRVKRKAARAQGMGNRRNPDRASRRGEPASPTSDHRKPRFGESGKIGPAGNTKVEPDGSKSE